MAIKVHKEDREIWTAVEREAWRLPEQMTVSEWTDNHRVLHPMTSAEPGQWRTNRTAYLRGIMDAFCDPFVEQITVVASTQVGKTEAIYNMIGYAIDQDPGPGLVVMPREDDAKQVSKNRIKPMLDISPKLRDHQPRLSDDMTKLEYRLDHMVLYLAGANSPAALASKPIRFLWLDEVDKYPKFSGREADPVKLATERTRTFWNKKIVLVSTPTTREGYIWREYESSDRRRYFVPCPRCGQYQVLVFGQIKWPEGEVTHGQVRKDQLAWYECSECKARLSDQDKTWMVQRGVWAPEDSEISPEGIVLDDYETGSHRGFWINALYSPWLTFSDIAAEFLRSKDYIELLMNFVNSWLAEIWEEKTEDTHTDFLIEKQGAYEEGYVPEKVLVLTAGVDVQKDHFYLIIRGWGFGEESWLIRSCRVESWEEVISIVFLTEYPRVSGDFGLTTRMACIDSGYRTDEVYEVCRKYRDVARPTKGHRTLPGSPFRVTRIDLNPATGKLVPGGLTLWNIDTTHFKNKVNRLVHSAPGDNSKWHLFRNVSEDYMKQFCSEHKVIERDRRTGRTQEVWKKKTSHAKNHLWDAEICAAAAADIIHVSAMRDDQTPVRHNPGRPSESETREQASWIRRGQTGSWIHGSR